MHRHCLYYAVSLLAAWIAPTWPGQAAVPDAPRAPCADWVTAGLLHFDAVPLGAEGQGRVEDPGPSAQLAPGRFGQALDAARSGVLALHVSEAAQPTDEVTIECWVCQQEPGKERLHRIVGRSGNLGFYVGPGTPRLTFFVSTDEWRSLAAPLPLGRWVHLAGTFDGRAMALFVDGEKVAEAPCSGRLQTSSTPYFLGTEAGRDEHRFPGLIDEVRLSTVARTDFFSGLPWPRPAPTTSWQALAPAAAAPDQGVSDLQGSVLDEAGEAVVGILVQSPSGATRTNSAGVFRLNELPRGRLPLTLSSPRYEPFAGTVALSAAREVAPPIVMKSIDPYLHPGGAAAARPVAWLASSLVEPPTLAADASPGHPTDGLQMLAVPGAYESRAVALWAGEDVVRPEATVDGLVGPDGATMAASAVLVRWTQRAPKRVQYTKPREDAVMSWRFLFREPPPLLRAGQVRQLVVTVQVPHDGRPGTYRGRLVLAAGGTEVSALPVELRVADVALALPGKRVGCYYRSGGKSSAQIDLELSDIREHGGSVLVWIANLSYGQAEDGSVRGDVSAIREAVLAQARNRLGPPFIVGTDPLRAADLAGIRRRGTPDYAAEVLASAAFRQIYGAGIRQVESLEKELSAGEFVYTWMDEVFNNARFDAWEAFAKVTRDLSDHRLYITFHNRDQSMVDRAAPYLDVRCYHGHTLDAWLGDGHSWDELKRELDAAGDEAWCYYNIREIAVTSEWVRLCNGYWLWKSPLTAHVPWTYYHFGGSPFDDLDSDTHDFAYAAPHPNRPEMVSSLEWECFRAGYDDLRYLTTLEQAVAAVRASGRAVPALAEAEAHLRAWRAEDPRVPAMAELLSPRDYDTRRADIVRLVQALRREP